MDEFNTSEVSPNEEINKKLRACFDGKIVRKDLTKSIKEGANVPVYVLEFLLGQYCSSDDPSVIEEGVANVKRILADNYVRPDEAQKILSVLRQRGSYTVIDKITVNLNIKKDTYEAEFSNLGIKAIPISEEYPSKFDRLLCGGIWCIVQLEYEYIEEDKGASPIHIRKLTPIQMPHVDIEELKQGRKAFTKEEWMSVLLRSIGMEPDTLSEREKWLLIARMLPLVENNFNLCELGPRSTGKSHLFKEISPNSILVSGGQTTVANLFYNMGRKTVGLVGLWDCVAFDEVAGINFKDKDGIQIMKDYMASGSFARGKEEKAASASMVFVGNINQSVDVLLKTSSLFAPFPPEMGTDTAFLDRMHCYIPGWEIPKFRPHHFTNDYGFITDYLAEFIRELRKEQYGDALDKYFRLGKNLNQRDTIAVRKMVGGFIKLLYPDGEYSKEQLEEILQISLEMRRRVKEQLKKLGGMEFYDVNFSYIDNETFEEHYVSVPEQGGGKLIPEGMCNPGQVYTVAQGKSGMLGVFRLESQMMAGNGKFERSGENEKEKYLYPTADILPALSKPHEPHIVVVTSLHCNGQIFGYTAMAYKDIKYIDIDELYVSWCDAVSNGLKNLQKRMRIQNINQQLEKLEADPLTGMLNRKGFLMHIPEVTERYMQEEKRRILVLITYFPDKMNMIDPSAAIADIILNHCRRQLCGRIQEGVFAALIPLETDENEAAAVVDFTAFIETSLRTRFNTDKIPEFIAEISEITSENINNSDDLLNDMLIKLFDKKKTAQNNLFDYKEQIYRLRKCIVSDPQLEWNIQETADKMCISRSHLQRLYKQFFSVSLKADIISARIRRAMQLLTHTEMRIQEVAERCGYNNENHFMHQFRDKTGMTASEYRRNNK